MVHLLNSSWFERLKMRCVTGTTTMHLSPKELGKILILIPPIAVQRKIVEYLDNFTELETRKQQYEYYRNKLLQFEKRNIKWLTIEDIFELRNGYTPSKKNKEFWDNGNIPWYKMEDIRKSGRLLSDSIQHITPKAIKGKGLFKANSIILLTIAISKS